MNSVELEKIKGDYAWIIMALGITVYDIVAIKSNKMETMSSALWRSLKHPLKFPFATIVWSVITYHLFGSSDARKSIKVLPNVIFKKSILNGQESIIIDWN